MTTSSMSSRERVHAAAKGLPVDRVPVMYWLNPHMACRMMSTHWPGNNFGQNLTAQLYWKLFPQKRSFKGADTLSGLPLLMYEYANGDYLLQLGSDIAFPPVPGLWKPKRTYFVGGRIRTLDAFGSVRGMGGIYMDVIEPAIKTPEDLKTFQMPDPTLDATYAGIRSYRALHPGACLLAETYGVQDLPSTQLWKMDAYMMAMVDYPEEMKSFMQRFSDWALETAVRGVRAGGDIVLIYDDYGYTGRTIMSMKMWKEFILPHLKRLIDAAHEEGALAILHSCGYQMPFLEYYLEAGLDILQSLQPMAGNDLDKAIDIVGDRLAFCTGIDIQRGESMTAEELKADILKSYRTGKRTGRFILGTTHMLQYTMPEENIRTIFQTVADIHSGAVG